MTNIVIVGGGFGGLQTVLGLEKAFKHDPNIILTLIDKRDYFLFTPNLYEVATAEENLVSRGQIKRSITLPFSEILKGKKIKFIQGDLQRVNQSARQVELLKKTVSYDYLVLALGSQSDFFNVPGAEKYSLVLKNLTDALRIRNNFEFIVQAEKYDINKKNIRVVVAGGGYTGVELAGELKGLKDLVARKNQYPPEKIEIEIIEANNKLVAGFDNRLSEDAYMRLQGLHVSVRLSSRITQVDEHFIYLLSGEKVAYDVLVWTTGVKACDVDMSEEMAFDRKGRMAVNEYFQTNNKREIFAIGDSACVMDNKGIPAPSSAQDAVEQGKYLAYALPFILKNQKPPKPYKTKKHGFIVSVGGKWAVMSYNQYYFKGWLAYVFDQLAHLNYYRSIVGWWKAIMCLVFQIEIYSKND